MMHVNLQDLKEQTIFSNQHSSQAGVNPTRSEGGKEEKIQISLKRYRRGIPAAFTYLPSMHFSTAFLPMNDLKAQYVVSRVKVSAVCAIISISTAVLQAPQSPQ
jgi:hypothetical protein